MRLTTIFDPALKELEFRHEPIIIRINKFDEGTAKAFNEEIAAAHDSEQTVIPVIIDSYGGYVDSLMSMISDITNSDKPVATIVIGKAMSCGAALMTFGTPGYRYVDQNARIMVHEISSGADGKITDIAVSAEETNRLNEHLFELMAKKCGKKKNYFQKHMRDKGNADWFMSPEEAVHHGLADHVRIPKFTRVVSVEYTFE